MAPTSGCLSLPRLLGRDPVLRTLDGWVRSLELGVGICGVVSGPRGIGRGAVLDAIRRLTTRYGIATMDLSEIAAFVGPFTAPVAALLELNVRDALAERAIRTRGLQIRAYPILLVVSIPNLDVQSRAQFVSAGFEVVELDPLVDDVTIEIACRTARENAISLQRSDVSRIARLAAGYPRYAVELALEPAAVVPRSVRDEIDVFSSIEVSTVARDLSLLAFTAVRTLRPDPILARRLDTQLGRRRFNSAIARAKAAGFIDATSCFRHEVIRLAFEQRFDGDGIATHLRCARGLLLERPTMERYRAIGDHYLAADLPEKATEFYEVVARDAMTDSRYEEASREYANILEITALPDALRAATHIALGRSREKLADSRGAIANFRRAFEMFERGHVVDPETTIQAGIDAALHCVYIDDFAASDDLCRRALHALVGRSIGRSHAAILVVSAHIGFAHQDFDRLARVVRTLERQKEQYPITILWEVLQVCAMIRFQYPEVTRSADLRAAMTAVDGRLTIAAADEAGDVLGLAIAHEMVTYEMFFTGNSEQAKKHLQSACEFAHLGSERLAVIDFYRAVMEIASLEGEPQRVLAIAQMFTDVNGGPNHVGRVRTSSAVLRAATALGSRSYFDVETLRDNFDSACASGNCEKMQKAAIAFCLAAIALGQTDRAARAIDGVLPRLRLISPGNPEILTVAARFGAPESIDHARSLLARYVKIVGPKIAAGVEALFEALLARRFGDLLRSRQVASRAADAFAAIGWRLFMAQSLHLADRLSEARDAEARMGVDHDMTDPFRTFDAAAARAATDGSQPLELEADLVG